MSIRDEAIEAVAKSLVRAFDGDFDALGGAWLSEWTTCAEDALAAALPVLLAPLRAVVDRALADVDAGHRNNAIAGLISADVILREIEGKS